MVYNQIWLNILVDDHQFGLSQILKINFFLKKEKKKNIV